MVGAVLVITLGGVVAVTGVPGAIGKLPRNRLAGVRTPATMRSDEAFAAGNRAAAPAIILGAAVAIASGVAVLFGAGQGEVLLGVLIMAVLTIVGGFLGSRAANR